MLLTACGGKDDEAAILQQAEISDEELYREGVALLDDNRYQSAIESSQEIERLYPFSPLATKAQIMVAYAHYRDEEYDQAVQVIDRFTRLHPGNPDIGYMYYLKAISYYERITDVARDQSMTQRALQALEEVMRRFPDTNYARDAKLKRDLVLDHLAGKQMEIRS
jgi:outer membrane protein assembly factor BamD